MNFNLIFFIVTSTVTLLNLIAILGIAFTGNKVIYPNYKWLSITAWYFLYPCLAYQIYFWTLHFNLFKF